MPDQPPGNHVRDCLGEFPTFDDVAFRRRRLLAAAGRLFPEAARADETLRPTGTAPDKLTDRQSVEKLISHENHRPIRYGGEMIMPGDITKKPALYLPQAG